MNDTVGELLLLCLNYAAQPLQACVDSEFASGILNNCPHNCWSPGFHLAAAPG